MEICEFQAGTYNTYLCGEQSIFINKNKLIILLHTYHYYFIPEGVADTSQIPDTHILPQ
jgi:hypothetical protein